MFDLWNILSLLIATGAVYYAVTLFQQIMQQDPGDEAMQKIARAVQEGGRAFLYAEYRWLCVFAGAVALLLCLGDASNGLGVRTAIAFLLGATASAGAGFFGMHCSTRAAVRATQAAKTSLGQALDVAFKSGTVMGMTVVGFGLIGITVLLELYRADGIQYVLGFSFGASSIALFARVGGGIYRKAADVGGERIGNSEAAPPAGDPRNPAVIAGSVGNNVSDVAGMGADLFESQVGAIIACALLGSWLGKAGDADGRAALMIYPVVLCAVGVGASFLGTKTVRADAADSLGAALFNGLIAAAAALVVGGALITLLIRPQPLLDAGGSITASPWYVYFAMVIGLVLGVVIGKVTEYYTAEQMAPTQEIAQQSKTGAAANIIQGLVTGMASTWIPVLLLAVGIWTCNALAGIYGICIAAVGMSSTLGIRLGVDAYGPVADNAGGLAAMTHQDPSVQQRTAVLDAAGKTAAAIGKGFAIGAAALTALALFSAFKQTARVDLRLDDARVLMGLLIGAMLPFVFSSMALRAVGRAANALVEEVRRQFREIKGLSEGNAEPEYGRCVEVSTRGALRQMVMPGLLAVIAPVACGMIFGKVAVGGLLAGSLVSGVMLALFMANAGGAWHNARKLIESGQLGGKGSDVHRAAVVGDTVGDPFKDTAGPSINILIKLMAIVSVLAIPLF
ncbi:MAG TPA: sodium-translocating pyrophosphatase [Planctomycetota bacterium]|nr:sodium-translocating pyrophosphatase [Planctomycetota bacterium]